MKYKYLENIKTGDLIGVYLITPKYNEALYSLGEVTEAKGVALFGEVFKELIEDLE